MTDNQIKRGATGTLTIDLEQKKLIGANSKTLEVFRSGTLNELEAQIFSDLNISQLDQFQKVPGRTQQVGSGSPKYLLLRLGGQSSLVEVFQLEDEPSVHRRNLHLNFKIVWQDNSDNLELEVPEILNLTDAHFCIVDQDLRFISRSREDLKTFGALNFQERFVHKEDFSEILNSIYKCGKYTSRISQITRSGVKVFALEAYASRDLRAGTDNIVVVQIDLSEQVRAEKNLVGQHGLEEIVRLKEEKMALKKDLELTSAVQDLILPEDKVHQLNHFRTYGKILPATHCSGDWWWIKKSGDVLIVCTADVTGHGAHSAMVTAILSAAVKIRFSQRSNSPLERVVELINKDIFESCAGAYLSTFTCLSINTKTGRGKAYLQGSPGLYQFLANGAMHSISGTSSLLGSDPSHFRSLVTPVHVGKGERLVIISDGYIEEPMPGGTLVGERRTKKIFKKFRSRGCRDFVNSALNEHRSLTGADTFADDITLVVIDACNQGKASF